MLESAPNVNSVIDTIRLALARGDSGTARSLLSAVAAERGAFESASDNAADAFRVPTLLQLGALSRDAGLDVEAQQLFAAAIASADDSKPDEIPFLVSALSQFGTLLASRGDIDEAESALTRSISLIDTRLRGEHPDLNAVLNVLSRLYARAGSVAEAGRLLERLLALKLAKGDDHPEVATVLASLASVRQAGGQHEEAERLSRRVLEIREKTLAPNHVAIASALEMLATSCSARGKVGEAASLYRRALGIREQTLGRAHATVSTLRDRIVDLQLQGSELLAGEGDEMAPLAVPMSQPKANFISPDSAILSPPSRARVLAPPLVGTYAPPSTRAESAMPHTAASAASVDPNEEQLLVLPQHEGTIDGGLLTTDAPVSLPDVEEAGDLRGESVLARMLAAARGVFANRRQEIIAGAVVAFVLAAAIVVEPRVAESSASASATAARPVSSEVSKATGNAVSTPAVMTPRFNDHAEPSASRSGLVQSTAAGSVAPRSRPQAHEPAATNEGTSASLQIGHVAPLSAPTLALGRADSIAHASELPSKLVEGSFSRQFWTAGIDKKAGTESSTGPTPAKLIGDMPHPIYPEFLRKSSVEGEVVVRFVIDATGHPDLATFEVVRTPHEAMTAAVRRVVQQMRFDPARTAGPDSPARTELVQISFVFQADAK